MSQAYVTAIEALKLDISEKEAKIQPLRDRLAAEEAALTPLKLAANQLCKLIGAPEAYLVDGINSIDSPVKSAVFRKDKFFNMTLGDAVIEYMGARKDANGGEPSPATTDEIYDALTKHGFKFDGESDINNKRALKIALVRNTTHVAKIDEDLFGLRKWYGMRAARKLSTSNTNSTPAEIAENNSDSPPAVEEII